MCLQKVALQARPKLTTVIVAKEQVAGSARPWLAEATNGEAASGADHEDAGVDEQEKGRGSKRTRFELGLRFGYRRRI